MRRSRDREGVGAFRGYLKGRSLHDYPKQGAVSQVSFAVLQLNRGAVRRRSPRAPELNAKSFCNEIAEFGKARGPGGGFSITPASTGGGVVNFVAG